MKILCIIRVSTDRQETDSQKKEMKEFCNENGFADNDIVYIEVAGASAVKENKAYLQMLEDIKTTIISDSSIKAAAVWHLNRLGRIESRLLQMKEFFVKNGIQLYCKTPNFTLLDSDGKESPAGSMVFSMFATMVKMDTQEMFAKMKRGRDAKREKGIYTGGWIKYGYKLDENKYLVINEEEASVVRTIFELYATGKYSYMKLTNELKARGIQKNGKPIELYSVEKILESESYCTNQVPIIDKSLYDKCLAIRKGQALPCATKESRNVNFGIGLIKCSCGGNYAANRDSYYCYSKLSDYRYGIPRRCDSPVIRISIMDDLIWYVTERLHIKYLMDIDNKSLDKYLEDKRIANLKLSTAKIELDKNKKLIDKLEDDYYTEGMEESKYNRRITALNGKRNQIESSINHLNIEIKEIDRQISMLQLSKSEKYVQSLSISSLDENEIEDRKKMKEIIFSHIDKVNLERSLDGKHQLVMIKIYAKNGLEFLFKYDIWLNTHRKKECCMFYEDKPLYIIEGSIRSVNKEVDDLIYNKIELPILNYEELGKATADLIYKGLE